MPHCLFVLPELVSPFTDTCSIIHVVLYLDTEGSLQFCSCDKSWTWNAKYIFM